MMSSDEIGPELLKALGVQSKNVIRATIDLAVGHPVAVSLLCEVVDDVGNCVIEGEGEFTSLKEIIKKYELIEKK